MISSIESPILQYKQNLEIVWNSLKIDDIEILSQSLLNAWLNRRNVFLCGNGGSSANANQLANDLIDGDHSESGVLGDYEFYIPMLREGGLACFHDVRLDPPKGIKPTWYGRLKELMPGSEEYFVSPENTGFGYWIKNSS